MQTVIFYTKLGCSNCDKAYRLLMDLAYDRPLKIDIVDVTHAHNHELKPKYENRIPVISILQAETELQWPFSAAEVSDYLG
ncbi:glutaredoxin family protein [Anaerolineales bacterium HSG24]|nr:glutaredoxin family protein [Anaerolineales bacterium HSG24]